ncbi:MAG: hypothetical protein ACYSWZ_14735 [Planctomycetota bacterium]|jgi:hypothetical protein
MSKNAVCYTVIVICVLSGISFAKYSGGNGTAEYPYLIATPNDLNAIGLDSSDWDKHFKMTADIDLADFTGTQFNIIGEYINEFTGVFDGNSHTISNFTYDSDGIDRIGLFSCVDGSYAIIKNLGLIEPNVNAGTGRYIGSLVGWGRGTIENCFAREVNIRGGDWVGGLAGGNRVTHNSWATGYVCGTGDGESGIGGLMGTVVGGPHEVPSWIGYCYASCTVTGAGDNIGGLVGDHTYVYGTVSHCYAISEVTGVNSVGGLTGANCGQIYHCYAAGSTEGNNNIGGLIGNHYYVNGEYTICFWDSEVNPDVNGIGNTTDLNVIGLPTAQMQQRSTFADAGWDMVNIWDIGENQTYPFLRTHLPSDINKDDETNFLDLTILTENWLGEK